MFAISQISAPAGAATVIALPSTNRVLSKMERTIILPNCGVRYGGNSKTNEDGCPFKSVLESNFDTKKVSRIP